MNLDLNSHNNESNDVNVNSDLHPVDHSGDVESPFVSIIIPSYNSGSLIDEALSACLKIKEISIEILVIDDASTDGTPEHIERSFPGVKLHRLPRNSGSGAAGRNWGLRLAKGRYIKFLDHDDLLQPRGFKAECLEALRSGADIVMSRWGVVSMRSDGLFCRRDLKLMTPPEPSRLIEAILQGETVPFTAAALYKRSLIGDEKWDARAATIDDFDWFCRMALKAGTVARVDAISYYWRRHASSIQGRSVGDGTLFEKWMLIRYFVYQKLEHQLSVAGLLGPVRRRLLARTYYGFLRYFARIDPGESRQLLHHIYQLDPEFTVDSSCEPGAKARRLIQLFGLPFFLRCYGLLGRSGARSQSGKMLAIDQLRPDQEASNSASL